MSSPRRNNDSYAHILQPIFYLLEKNKMYRLSTVSLSFQSVIYEIELNILWPLLVCYN